MAAGQSASVGVPDVVSVAVNVIVADVREGLLALAVGAGPQAMMAADVQAPCNLSRRASS